MENHEKHENSSGAVPSCTFDPTPWFKLPQKSNKKEERLDVIKTTLEKLEGKIKVVAVDVETRQNSTECDGYINFEPTLRNITSSGPRDYYDPNQIIYANEEYDDFDNVKYNRGPGLETPNNSVDDCLHLACQLYQALPGTPFRYTFNLTECEGERMKSLVSKCLVGDYEKITFCGRMRCTDAFSYDEFDFLMNLVKRDTYFEFNCEVIDGFRHEKAFQFKSFFYHHAKWITLDDLKSLRNHNVVRFGRSSFSNEDFNEFLKFWTESDEPMLNTFSAHIVETPFFIEGAEEKIAQKISLEEALRDAQSYMQHLPEDNKCDETIILSGLKYFSPIPRWTGRMIPLTHYIKSKTSGKCSELRIYESRIELNTRTTNFLHKNIQQAMTISNEQEGLLKKKSELMEEIDRYKNTSFDYQEKSISEEEIKKMDLKRERIEIKLEESKERMKELGFC